LTEFGDSSTSWKTGSTAYIGGCAYSRIGLGALLLL
jgi:hypothetical protein